MGTIEQRISKLRKAFRGDGFEVRKQDEFIFQNRIGIIARHRTATNYDTGEAKRAYYVEGSPYQMGFLMGWMAEPEIARMSSDFVANMISAMIRSQVSSDGVQTTKRSGLALIDVESVLIDLLYSRIRAGKVEDAVPEAYREEIDGIVDGCAFVAGRKQRKPRVAKDQLWALNAGFDCILAVFYSGRLLQRKLPKIEPEDLRVPYMCNAFALLDQATDRKQGVLFGRDFMFGTGDVFQDVACLTIYNPDPGAGGAPYASVHNSAPGFVGSVAGMNVNGVAAGVDMSPGANCNVHRPGMNSLLIVRDCVEHGTDGPGAVERIISTKRGVSYDYPVADGGGGRNGAWIVEAGCSTATPAFTHAIRGVDRKLRALLPDDDLLRDCPSGDFKNGVMVRDSTFDVPKSYLDLNPALWKYFGKPYHEDGFGPDGYLEESWKSKDVPDMYYFAPARSDPDQFVMVSNHYLHPEMRLYGMKPWTNRIAKDHIHEVQWRYDELNHRIRDALNTTNNNISYAQAKELIDFLAPEHTEGYYTKNPVSRNGNEQAIDGCVSLFDLKHGTVESHFGYYKDKWVKLTLGNYVD